MVQHGGTSGFNRSEQEEEEVEISSVSALPRDSSISDLICASSAYTLHPQHLRQISRDKSAKLAQQHSEVQWLEQQNATLIERLGEANTLVSDLGAQDRVRKEELAWAIEERDAQSAAAEQKAQEVELLNATLRQKDEALEARAAQCARLEEARDAQAVSLTEKEALIERQGNAIFTAETTLTAANAEIEEGRKCLAGKYHGYVWCT